MTGPSPTGDTPGSHGPAVVDAIHLANFGPLPPKTLFLGLGNDILSDDAIGLEVVRAVRGRLAGQGGVAFAETTEMGLALLDLVVGYESLVIIDAIQTGQAAPGFVHELSLDDLKLLPSMSPHFLGVGELLALGRQLGLQVPSQVRIFAVEIQDSLTVSSEMTPQLLAALHGVVDQILVRWCETSSPVLDLGAGL
jgi:hydrogenase maturation protease